MTITTETKEEVTETEISETIRITKEMDVAVTRWWCELMKRPEATSTSFVLHVGGQITLVQNVRLKEMPLDLWGTNSVFVPNAKNGDTTNTIAPTSRETRKAPPRRGAAH
jgi:hypothetical protein